MPQHQPDARQLHVDQALTDFAIQWGQDNAKDFAADMGSTLVRSEKQSDLYVKWKKGDYYRLEMAKRADGTASKLSGIGFDRERFATEVYSLATFITERQRVQARDEIELERAKIRWLMGQAKLNREKIYAAKVFGTGLWTVNTEQTGLVAGPIGANQFLQWGDGGSDPILDITKQMHNVHTQTGKMPNVAVTNKIVARRLIDHPDFVNRNTSSGMIPAKVSLQDVADVLELDRIMVGRAVENTAAEGQPDAMADVFGNHFLLMHLTPSMSDEDPTAVGGFAWNEFEGVDATGAKIDSWFDRDLKATKYEVEDAIDYQITAEDLGVFFANAAV